MSRKPAGARGPVRIVLVGLPGAGKSTVGALVAEALGWEFVDLDELIARTAGMSVPEIFVREHESGFRRREREATKSLVGKRRVVLAPGGGWPMDRSNPASLGPGSLTVYLEVAPEVAAARMAAMPGSRPLLEGLDPAGSLRDLHERREETYLQSDHTVTVDSMAPGAAASLIVALARGVEGD
jgi:shikimate kinase